MYTLGISLTTVSEYIFLEKIYFKTLILQTEYVVVTDKI